MLYTYNTYIYTSFSLSYSYVCMYDCSEMTAVLFCNHLNKETIKLFGIGSLSRLIVYTTLHIHVYMCKV